MAATKWQFEDLDSGQTIIMRLNPAEPGPVPGASKELGQVLGTRSGFVVFEAVAPLSTLSMSGIAVTSGDLARIEAIATRNRLRFTDDLGRVFDVMPTSYAISRQAGRIDPWVHSYEIEFTVLDAETSALDYSQASNSQYRVLVMS